MTRVRFQLDEHLSDVIADALRRYGADILTATEAGLRGQPDAAYISRGIAENQVIVTRDADFLRLVRVHPDHAGIIFCTASTRGASAIIAELSLIYEVLEQEELYEQVLHI